MGVSFRDFSIGRPSRFKVNDDGTITELPGFSYSVTAAQQHQGNHRGGIRNAQDQAKQYDQDAKNYPYATISEATNVVSKKQAESLATLKKQYEDQLSQDRTYSSIADQIAGLAQNTSGLGALPNLNPGPVSPAAAQGATLPTFGLGGGTPPAPSGGSGDTRYTGGTPYFDEKTGTYRPPASDRPTAKTQPSRDYVSDAVKIVTDYAEKISKATADKKTDELKKLTDERNKKIQDLASDYVKTIQPTTAANSTPTAKQIAANITGAVGSLSAFNNYGASDLSTRLNFQVSNQQILDDYNTAYSQRLARIAEQGASQITGIQQRLDAATRLLAGLPANDPRRTTSDQYIAELRNDLASVQGAVSQAIQTQKNFKPLTISDPKAQTQIAQFREYLKLPEERSLDQIRQIDPATFSAAQSLTNRYMDMAGQPIGDTTDPRTEQLRASLEDEAINQLALGSQLDSDSLRQYQQASRAAQTARGNIFGVAPAVEEAVQTGAAGEQRRLARFGAASNFLSSGQSRSDALRENLDFRDTLLQNRLGQASNFIAGGPSLYNLANARTGQQQAQFQNYINANQSNPGQFNPQANQVPFYQTTSPNIPVDLAQTAASIYNTMQNAQASMYGSQVGAIASSYQSPASAFGNIASGLGNLFSFKI